MNSRIFLLFSALCSVSLLSAASFPTVTVPGPLFSFTAAIAIQNSTSEPLTALNFDLSRTIDYTGSAPLAMNAGSGIFSVVNGTSGGFSLLPLQTSPRPNGNIDAGAWTLSFTSFLPGQSFSFRWNPECKFPTACNPEVANQVGLLITAFSPTGSSSASLAINSTQSGLVAVPNAAVPEPGSLSLALAGLVALFAASVHRLRTRS